MQPAPIGPAEKFRSIALSLLGLVTMLMVLVHAFWLPDTFPGMCSVPSAPWESSVTIGLWLLTLLASLSAAAATYARLRPETKYFSWTLWALSIAAVPVLLALPSSLVLLGATADCAATSLFLYLSWYIMGLIVCNALFCVRLLVHETDIQRVRSAQESAQFNQANQRLQQLDQQKSEFVAIASHQLRSPLTSVRGYTTMLLEESFGKIPKQVQAPLQRIQQSATHMASTIEDYLNVSKIELGTLSYDNSDFNLADEVMHTCDDMRPRILQDGIILLYRSSLQSQGVVNADRNKVIQIVHNLIENAHQYTQKGTITVFVRDDMRQKKMYVDVIDTGIGMTPDTLHNIFQKFARGTNANDTHVHGTGLGLYVARTMAEAMGGTINADSTGEGKGSRFTLELPLAL